MSKIYTEPAASEREYQKLAALGQKLGVPIPQAFLEMKVTMPDGRVVHHHRQRSHSWVRNAYNVIFSQIACVNTLGLFGPGTTACKSTGGGNIAQVSAIGMVTDSSQLQTGRGYTAIAGSVASGIVVGSGAAVESFEDFVLQTPIANGVGAGQLSYIQSNAYVVSYNAGTLTLSMTATRFMNNNSGGDVLVNEVALYAIGSNLGATTWCKSRDHLGATITIPNTGQLKVTYVV